MLPKEKNEIEFQEKKEINKRRIDIDVDEIEFKNFFDLNDNDLNVLNPYSLEEALKRIDSLSYDDIKDNLKYFQVKDLELKNYEELNTFSLDNILFVTSSKRDGKDEKIEKEFYLLNDLSDFLISNEDLKKKDGENNKKISFQIQTQENGKKCIIINCLVDANKISENIIKNFISKSPSEKASKVKEDFKNYLAKNLIKHNFKLTIKIQFNSLNRIYYNFKKGEYFLDLQSPPIFKTNLFLTDKNEDNNFKDENSIFPFRNFEDEISNLKYRHFIIMLQKNVKNVENVKKDEMNFDTNEELSHALENLFKNRKGEIEKHKYEKKHIVLKKEEKNRNLRDFFNYTKNEEIRKKLEKLFFLKKIQKREKKEYNDEEVIKLFYQTLSLISENILSYFNGVIFLENLLINNYYRYEIFGKCTNDNFPIFLNITLTKILDKYQNSLEEKSLKEFEKEMKDIFNLLHTQYESEGLEEVLRPSKNDILMRVQRCVITPTYILFTPYVLEEGNRIIRKFIKRDNSYINYAMLCTFKMDSLEEARWNNTFLMEYIKFILAKGFYIGEKKFRFFNYSQSQFRNMSCWLLTNPEKILTKIGDFSNIKQLSKYAARISQTLTTTLETIKIHKDNIVNIPDKKSKDGVYTFSDGVGKIAYDLAKGISEKLKLNYVPSCFQGRFLGCKGVWTTMWKEVDSKIYCRTSQIKFKVEPEEYNLFELCDYSRYIQSYLNRQIILLLSSLGIEDDKFLKKLDVYKNKLNDQKFVLSLVHYPEWNQMLQKMNSCGINRTNDRLLKSLIESNLDILYNDVKKKARIYVEESAYVIGIMDEYDILEYGQAYLQIKKGNFNIILDKKCTVAKCPCLHPGDIRVLTFKKYNEDDESTKKYEVFNKYENVIIFPSKGKRPHPDECSGSDLDGDNYFIFYDDDLVPEKLYEPMSYIVDKKEEPKKTNFTINDVIRYFAEYTNLNNLGLIGDAHLAISDKESAKSELAKSLAKKFSKAVDAPKTGEKVILSEEETPKKFPHYMGKIKNKSYHSTSVLGKLYDKTNEIISKRIKNRQSSKIFFDKDLILENWENYAFLALLYYRDYYNDLVSLLKKNEINGESVLLTGNNIDNENSILSKKKHNYDLREKIEKDIHNLFIKNKNNFYEAIQNILINKKNGQSNNKDQKNEKIYWIFNKKDLINNDSFFVNNLNIFASACYMVSYNIVELKGERIGKKDKSIFENYCEKTSKIINENLMMDNDLEGLNEISEYESLNMGIDYYTSSETSYDNYFEKIYKEKKQIKKILKKKKNDMINFIKDLQNTPIPADANQENQYRILSFPWCISGHILSYIKFLNLNIESN